ncbi:MAG: ribose-phosphate pyrophosphokinase-like domain-containing protein [Candidatus Levybacteria bacterium]|nr:ribose-phosphate pyrophosphokinase-like domain-containing protein [Candidatus Levybacteria bacterium]
MKIFSGSANKPLAEKIVHELGIPLSPLDIHVFPDGEKRVRVLERVVNQHCVVVQPTSTPADAYYGVIFYCRCFKAKRCINCYGSSSIFGVSKTGSCVSGRGGAKFGRNYSNNRSGWYRSINYI